jgi:hypothetical protein
MAITSKVCSTLTAQVEALQKTINTICLPKPKKTPIKTPAKPKPSKKPVKAPAKAPTKKEKVVVPLPAPAPEPAKVEPKAKPKPKIRAKTLSSDSDLDDKMALMKVTSQRSSHFKYQDLMLGSVFNYKLCCVDKTYRADIVNKKTGKPYKEGKLKIDTCQNKTTKNWVIPSVRYDPSLYTLQHGNSGEYEMWTNGSDGLPIHKDEWNKTLGPLVPKGGYMVFKKFLDMDSTKCGTLK